MSHEPRHHHAVQLTPAGAQEITVLHTWQLHVAYIGKHFNERGKFCHSRHAILFITGSLEPRDWLTAV